MQWDQGLMVVEGPTSSRLTSAPLILLCIAVCYYWPWNTCLNAGEFFLTVPDWTYMRCIWNPGKPTLLLKSGSTSFPCLRWMTGMISTERHPWFSQTLQQPCRLPGISAQFRADWMKWTNRRQTISSFRHIWTLRWPSCRFFCAVLLMVCLWLGNTGCPQRGTLPSSHLTVSPPCEMQALPAWASDSTGVFVTTLLCHWFRCGTLLQAGGSPPLTHMSQSPSSQACGTSSCSTTFGPQDHSLPGMGPFGHLIAMPARSKQPSTAWCVLLKPCFRSICSPAGGPSERWLMTRLTLRQQSPRPSG